MPTAAAVFPVSEVLPEEAVSVAEVAVAEAVVVRAADSEIKQGLLSRQT